MLLIAQVYTIIRRRIIAVNLSIPVEIDDISIVDIQFSKEFSQAVASKQVAEQESTRAVYITEKSE